MPSKTRPRMWSSLCRRPWSHSWGFRLLRRSIPISANAPYGSATRLKPAASARIAKTPMTTWRRYPDPESRIALESEIEERAELGGAEYPAAEDDRDDRRPSAVGPL